MNTIENHSHISELWEQLEKEKNLGLVKRLYSSEFDFYIYATYQYPESYIGIAFNFSNSIKINISNLDNLKELKVLLLDDTSFIGSKLLIVELLHSANKDIFATLCENLIQSVIKLDNESIIINTIINQLNKWKILFEKSSSEGLSIEQQQGLYGELVFLHKYLLQQNTNHLNVLNTWIGVDAALRDFQGTSWAVEVKTTATNNPQKVTINGERQLDETLLENLFLFHCSVEVSNGNGETLNQKIANIRFLLENNVPAFHLFNSKLFEVGYFEVHANKYESRFYKIRSENYYQIFNDFPRIKEKELRCGICCVRYDITLAMCYQYLVTENKLLNIIQKP